MRKIYLIICIAMYTAMRFLVDGYLDIMTDVVMSVMIWGVWALVCWSLDDIKARRKENYMQDLDNMYKGNGPDYIDFKR